MKVLSFTIFCVLFLGFSIGVKAQICGPSRTKIYVRDNQGNIIKDVKFEFVDVNEDAEYLKGPWLMFEKDAYSLYFGLDRPSPEGNQLLKISAVGFEAVEQTIYFRQPQYQIFSLTLKRKGTNEQSYFEELLPFRGSVRDKDENRIAGIKVVLTDIQGKKFETLTHEYGYEIPVREGIYDVEVVGAKGFASAKYEKFEMSKKIMSFDAILEKDLEGSLLVTELVCKKSTIFSDRFNCVLATKNPNEETQK